MDGGNAVPAQGRRKAGPLQFLEYTVKSIRSRNVPPIALAKSKSPNSDGVVWLGAGLLVVSVIVTICILLNG
jgi:hypothetical protein